MKFHDIKTERFLLKILTEDQVSPVYLSWFSPQNNVEYIEYASKKNITIESLKTFVQEKLISTDCLFFAIYDFKENKHIGNIKFEPFNISKGYTVLGVLIGAAEWRGKGVFTEVVEAIAVEFKKNKIHKIYLGVNKENNAAVKAYEKAGFISDAENFLEIKPEKGFSMVKHL